MGVASALNTALTGLTAAETTIEVVGNNLANSNTVGFKASEANFATQFLQTRGLGSAPSANSGGTVPRQIGLGTMVADITPDFNQGTIEISANPSDLAIQGDGFFIVQGNSGEELYTRNGIFKLNAQNQLVSITGNRVLGYGVNDQFQIQTGSLVPIEIPLGNEQVAVATSNVYLEGSLFPTGDLATTAEIIQTGILGDASYTYPPDDTNAAAAVPPNVSGSSGSLLAGGLPAGTYNYRVGFANSAHVAGVDDEGVLSEVIGGPFVSTGVERVDLTLLPDPAAEDYSYLRVYRSTDGDPYEYIGELPATGAPLTFSDSGLADGGAYNEDTLEDFSYSYYVTFYNATRESRPSEVIAQIDAGDGGRIRLTDLPTSGEWTGRRIYRNLSTDDSSFHRVATIGDMTTTAFIDTMSDTTLAGEPELNRDGPTITVDTLLTDVRTRSGDSYEQVFEAGTLALTASKGGQDLTTKTMGITSGTRVSDLIDFMQGTMGIHTVPGPDDLHPIPPDAGSGSNPGGSLTTDGRIQFISNNGLGNALSIDSSGMQLTTASGADSVDLPFNSSQTAIGESVSADLVVYDSLGIQLSAEMTVVLESSDSSSTTYRWFANSPEDTRTIDEIDPNTGLITFDSVGNLISSSNNTIQIERGDVASVSPLSFSLDFSQISGLDSNSPFMRLAWQDGSEAGTLTSFIIGEDGTIRGVFSNGVTRDLGQIRLARFANPNGLEQKGQNMFASGVNSGLPLEGNPGEQGIGTIIAGAVELSNTDIGSNLVDLILASTMYRGNTRVITTAQQMLDELLSLRR
ncbi:MAG: hypothetical protein A2V70_11920 [Planctomycetes bacterium RBG_13_63_9]|nr:MAG: hypothetical protein A2V70_11920 [Planctomycetes bacterium RBG_13_63_9]